MRVSSDVRWIGETTTEGGRRQQCLTLRIASPQEKEHDEYGVQRAE